MLQSVNVI